MALLLATNVTAIVIGFLAGCDSDMHLAQFPAMRSPDSMECTLTSESRDSSVVGEPARAGLSSRSSTIDDRSDSEQDYKLTYEVSRGDHTTVPPSWILGFCYGFLVSILCLCFYILSMLCFVYCRILSE